MQERLTHGVLVLYGFSALQRAENSSIFAVKSRKLGIDNVSVLFSEPKIPQSTVATAAAAWRARFSALQRAENSSISLLSMSKYGKPISFSALQRAENSSIRNRQR